MSWDSYVDKLIQQTKDKSGAFQVDRACIVSLVDGVSWTTAEHDKTLKLQGQEGNIIARCFKCKDFTPFMSNGVTVEGVTYQFLREEEAKVVLAKKKDHGAITMQAAKTAIVIAHIPEGGQQVIALKAVAVIVEYLESLGM